MTPPPPPAFPSLSPDVVMMQQFVVEASRMDQHPWVYLAGADFEILSRCDRPVNNFAATGIRNDLPLQQEILPPAYWSPIPTPMTFILFNRKPEDLASSPLVPQPEHRQEAEKLNWGGYAPRGQWVTGGISSGDSDTLATVQNEYHLDHLVDLDHPGRWRQAAIGLPLRLYECAPALPEWYQQGVIGPNGLFRVQPQPSGMILAGAVWVSQPRTDAILSAARKAKTSPVLPPVETLFAAGEDASRLRSPEWLAEAALFLRWGILGDVAGQPSHLQAFSRFVERSRTEPVTEAMFRECFGFGYAELQTILSQYLVRAVNEPMMIAYRSIGTWPPARPKLAERNATPAEIARILGDWERMEGDQQRLANPAVSRIFLDAAGKTLRDSYGKGERDPRLLAALGMYDYDTGAEVEARSLLGAATQAGVARPAAYFELAELNYLDAVAHPAAPDGKFSGQQVIAVINPLFAAARQARLKASAFKLMADTWARCAIRPPPKYLAAVRAGVSFYPRDPALTLSAAQVYAQWGYAPEAEALIASGLRFADGPAGEKLLAVRTSLQPAH